MLIAMQVVELLRVAKLPTSGLRRSSFHMQMIISPQANRPNQFRLASCELTFERGESIEPRSTKFVDEPLFRILQENATGDLEKIKLQPIRPDGNDRPNPYAADLLDQFGEAQSIDD